MANSRPVSPHEQAFLQRQGGGRFNVVPKRNPKRKQKSAESFKSLTAHMMESSGRPTLTPGGKRPTRPRLSR